MTLDECVYALADLLEETEDVTRSQEALKDILTIAEFDVDAVVNQFIKEYACTPEVYVKNIQDDRNYLLDEDFDSL